jgi:hypothetical protein
MVTPVEVRAWLTEDRSQIAIELWANAACLGHVRFAASELEQFIHQLASHRANMAEEVIRDLEIGSRLTTVIDPVWRGPREESPAGKRLAFRHPGLGWLSFLFATSEATAIAKYLAPHLVDPSEKSNHRKPSVRRRHSKEPTAPRRRK